MTKLARACRAGGTHLPARWRPQLGSVALCGDKGGTDDAAVDLGCLVGIDRNARVVDEHRVARLRVLALAISCTSRARTQSTHGQGASPPAA